MRWRWIFISGVTAAFAALVILSVGLLRPAAPRLNVIILTMESARAEVMAPDTMPNVWRLAQQHGTRFTQHRAVSGWTAANIVSLLTGASPFLHGVHSRDQHVPADWRTPLADLSGAGWRVAGLQSFMQVEGFQDLGLSVEPGASLQGWLAERAKASTPFVLWYHYLNTHLPYAAPPPFRPDWLPLLPAGDADAKARVEQVTRMPAIPAGSIGFRETDRPAIRALYLADFRAFDAWFADFWTFFERSGLRENTLLILTADHGEELLERGHVGHASTTHAGHLHEEIVHLPLVVWLPERQGKARPSVVTALTDHLDIMPMIFQTLGRQPTRPFSGRNLYAPGTRAVWRGVTSGAGFAEPAPFDIPRFVFSILEWPWKLHLVRDRGQETAVELFNLEKDPDETSEQSAVFPEIAARLKADLLPSIAAMRMPSPPLTPDRSLAERPEWIFPDRPGAYRYDDLSGRFRLEWKGDPNRTYRVQYEAGTGLLHLTGEFDVAGTERDFGTIDRSYWDRWVVSYSRFRIRVGVAGRDDRWSEWLDLQAIP